MTSLFQDIEFLKGVGKARGEKYRKLNITTPFELLYHIPRKYLDYRCHIPISQTEINEYSVLKLTVTDKLPSLRIKGGMTVYKAVATDGFDSILIVFYNNMYAFNALSENDTYYMYGKITGNFVRREISAPQFVRSSENVLIQPIYHLTAGLSANMVRKNIRQAVEIMHAFPFETLPQYVIESYSLCTLNFALTNIHFPESIEASQSARRRLAFDELLYLQLGMSMLKSNHRLRTGCIMNSKIASVQDFFGSLPFELTDAQKNAVSDVVSDLCREVPMNRLLQGDVGCGKTVVAAAACWFAAKNGMQSALMAPTEILASQHFETISRFLEPFGMKTALLTGSMSAKAKKSIKDDIASGEVCVIIGTHAIIQKDIDYKCLALVITDEQHRFGVAQRAALAQKGNFPHKLVMSATPIPRTLALMIYGDLDISAINQLPKGRKPVATYAVTGKMRSRAFNYVRKIIGEGRQAYIVCPMIDDSQSELLAVKSYAENASEELLHGCSLGILHGKMSSAEKDSVMNDFKDGKIQSLVCTTVVEVGVDVPNAAVIVIENADRFGLSQLHQLRGRVGRGLWESSCILITDNPSEECRKRMKIMCRISDGFKISEEDLKLRGPGDFFGNRQHGLPPLKIADIACDMELMEQTKLCAADILKKDPTLSLAEHRSLKIETLRMFSDNIVS